MHLGLGSTSWTLSDRPVWHFWTVHFDSSIHPKDRLLWVKWPFSLTHGRSLPSRTVHFRSNDSPVWLQTVRFWTDRPLSPFWTAHFETDSIFQTIFQQRYFVFTRLQSSTLWVKCSWKGQLEKDELETSEWSWKVSIELERIIKVGKIIPYDSYVFFERTVLGQS